MPIRRIEHTPLPFAGKRHTPDYSRLAALYLGQGRDLADISLQKGAIAQRGLEQLGKLFSGYVAQGREEEATKAAGARRDRERREDKEFSAEQNRLERQERENREFAERAIRDKERAEDAKIRKAEKDEAAVAKAIDEAPRGIVDMTGNRALYQAAQQFPAQAARFVKQDGVDVLPMTGAEKQAHEREKAMAEDRKADNARVERQIAETARHNRALEATATTKAAAPDFYIRDGQVLPLKPTEVVAGDIPYSASAMQGRGGESADARSQRTAAALNSIDMLKGLAPKRSPGPLGMLEGAGDLVAGYAGYNTNARQYSALLQPTAMQMAVAIQGAAGLSNAERETMVGMLGNIATMDYETQMALLEKASELVRGGADVQQVKVLDPKTQKEVVRWAPMRSRMPGGVSVNPAAVANPSAGLPGAPITVMAPDGKPYTFKSQAEADAFKKAAGIK